MGQQTEEQEKLRRRWRRAAKRIWVARMRERRAYLTGITQVLVSSVLTLVFVVGTSIWLAHRIMGH